MKTYFSPGTESLFHSHPPLEPSRTRELAAQFLTVQGDLCSVLAELVYPLHRLMQEMRAGNLASFREGSDQNRKEGGRKVAYRFAGITPTHQEEYDAQYQDLREGRISSDAFRGWESAFLLRFTFEVLEQVAARALPAPMVDAESTAPARRRLSEALGAARRLRDGILNGNLLLAAQIAIRRSPCHSLFSLDELFAAGTDGLLIAINRYNPAVAQFSTYATPWISMAIDRFAAKNRSVIRVPIGLQDKARRKGGEAAKLIPQVQSLEEPLAGADEDLRLEDAVADPSAASPADEVEHDDLSRQLAAGMAELSPLHQLIVSLRSGVGDAAALGSRLFEEEAALSLARGRATAAAAARTLDEPAHIRMFAPLAETPAEAPAEIVPLRVAV